VKIFRKIWFRWWISEALLCLYRKIISSYAALAVDPSWRQMVHLFGRYMLTISMASSSRYWNSSCLALNCLELSESCRTGGWTGFEEAPDRRLSWKMWPSQAAYRRVKCSLSSHCQRCVLSSFSILCSVGRGRSS
jgi:hypothetical protein